MKQGVLFVSTSSRVWRLQVLLLWLSVSSAHAALRVWTGSGTDVNWSTPANWFAMG